MDKHTTREAIRRCGGVVALANRIGITKSAVSQWVRVPAEHVLTVASVSQMSPHVLRPDIFGAQPAEQQAAWVSDDERNEAA